MSSRGETSREGGEAIDKIKSNCLREDGKGFDYIDRDGVIHYYDHPNSGFGMEIPACSAKPVPYLPDCSD